jgi:hypothetical protein
LPAMQLLDLITGMLLRCSFITAGQPGKNGGGGGFETEVGRGVRHYTVQMGLLKGHGQGRGRKFKNLIP